METRYVLNFGVQSQNSDIVCVLKFTNNYDFAITRNEFELESKSFYRVVFAVYNLNSEKFHQILGIIENGESLNLGSVYFDLRDNLDMRVLKIHQKQSEDIPLHIIKKELKILYRINELYLLDSQFENYMYFVRKDRD